MAVPDSRDWPCQEANVWTCLVSNLVLTALGRKWELCWRWATVINEDVQRHWCVIKYACSYVQIKDQAVTQYGDSIYLSRGSQSWFHTRSTSEAFENIQASAPETWDSEGRVWGGARGVSLKPPGGLKGSQSGRLIQSLLKWDPCRCPAWPVAPPGISTLPSWQRATEGGGRKGEICIKTGICLKLHSFHPALVSFQFWTHELVLICIQLCTYWQTMLPGYYSLSISLPACCSLLLSPDTQSVWGIISFFGLRSLRGFGEGHPNIFH